MAKYSIEEGTVCLLASGSKAVDAGLRLADLQVWLQIKQSDSSAATSADLEPTEQLARENQDVLFIVAAQQRIHKGGNFPNLIVMNSADLGRFATPRLAHIFCSPAEIEDQIKNISR